MGIQKKLANLGSALFSSVQSRVLGLLFGQPGRDFQMTEVIELAGSGRGAVQRELERLTEAGILVANINRGRKTYQANRDAPIFAELRSIIVKTVGLVDPLKIALMRYRNKIDVAFVYGSVAKGEDTAKSDIDLMIIGDDLGYSEVFGALQNAEKILNRPINPNLLAKNDWARKLADKRSFVTRINQQPKLFVIGTTDDLKELRQSG
jgi:predicted nucleotidyltransferase